MENTLEEMNRSFDIEYWQSRSPEERAAAVWELVVAHHLRNGGKMEDLKVQKDIEHFQRREINK